jgi:hypothetical protein
LSADPWNSHAAGELHLHDQQYALHFNKRKRERYEEDALQSNDLMCARNVFVFQPRTQSARTTAELIDAHVRSLQAGWAIFCATTKLGCPTLRAFRRVARALARISV